MSTFTIVLLTIAVFVVLVLIVAALQPAGFRISRTAVIKASSAAVFRNIDDFHRWEAWSPWEKLDPSMTREFDGAPSGTGAGYHWLGSKKVGEGRMTILDCRPSEYLQIKLEFLKPFAATNEVVFNLKPAGGQTEVEWSMSGTRNFMLKVIGLFMSMDKMVGPDYERGLAQLKAVAEGQSGGQAVGQSGRT